MDRFTFGNLDIIFGTSNPLTSLLTQSILKNAQFPEIDRAGLRESIKGKTPLYILKSKNDVDFLLLTTLLEKYNFPIPQLTLANESFFSKPVTTIKNHIFDLIGGKNTERESKRFIGSLMLGKPGLLSMFSTGNFMDPEEKPIGGTVFFKLISDFQNRRYSPEIAIIPVVPVWERTGMRKDDGESLIKRYLGSIDAPHLSRQVVQILSSMLKPVLKIGEPIDLRDFINSEKSSSNMAKTNNLKSAIISNIEQEWQTLLGPKIPEVEVIRRKLSRNKKIVNSYHEAVEAGKPQKDALKEIQDAIASIPASPTPLTLSLYHHTLKYVWDRLFKGIELNVDGFLKMREASKKGPLLILPAHKSHIDYLIISWIMEKNQLPIPHIAAGENLSFFPLGPIFRRGGAFFIKRSFRGDKLYKTVLNEYIALLLKTGISIEFFPEGTRSRNGKTNYPKYGLISMIAALLLEGEIPSPQIVPVSVTYEKVIEEKAYQEELKGQAKKSENIFGILKSLKVMLGRYGRVNIKVSEPFDMKDFLGDISPTDPIYKEKINKLSLKIISDISKNSVITTSMLTAASVLLSNNSTIDKNSLFGDFKFFLDIVMKYGGTVSSGLKEKSMLLKKLDRSLQGFSHTITFEEGYNIKINPSGRSRLAFYRNGMLQIIAPLAISACASLFDRGDYIMFNYIWDTLKREFPQLNILDKKSVHTENSKYLEALSRVQIIKLSMLLVDIIEGQYLALQACDIIFNHKYKGLNKKALVGKIQHYGNKFKEDDRSLRVESGNKSLYMDLLDLLLEKEILFIKDDLFFINDLKKDDIMMEYEARKKIISQINLVADQLK